MRSYDSHFADRAELRKHIWIRAIPVSFISSFLYLMTINDISKDLLNSLVTLFSILIGFSYSVMIFISTSPKGEPSDPSGRVLKLRWDRINNVAINLYGNLHLFCMMSIIIVIFCLLGVAFADSGLDLEIKLYQENKNLLYNIVNFLFIAVLVEVFMEFGRILRRTDYLFSERIKG